MKNVKVDDVLKCAIDQLKSMKPDFNNPPLYPEDFFKEAKEMGNVLLKLKELEREGKIKRLIFYPIYSFDWCKIILDDLGYKSYVRYGLNVIVKRK